MKIAVSLALVALLSPILAQETNEVVSSDDAVKLGMDVYFELMNETNSEEQEGAASILGCCPCIVKPGPKGSVIQPFTGYRGNAAIIVDWGYECEPRPFWKRACTPDDKGFVWYVSWGDGTHNKGYSESLGPFQTTHQYKSYIRSYGVKAVYCSNPKFGLRCCSVLYRVIDVSFDPKNPHPDVFGN